jgi:hypothetical protein
MMVSVWFIVLTIFNPNVGEFGEAFIQQHYIEEIPKTAKPPIYHKQYKSYDECKSKLYKIIENDKYGFKWTIRKSEFKSVNSLVLQRMSGQPSKRHLQYYTCNEFKVDKEKL